MHDDMAMWTDGLTGYSREGGRNGIRHLVAADNVNPLARHLAARNPDVVYLPASYGRGEIVRMASHLDVDLADMLCGRMSLVDGAPDDRRDRGQRDQRSGNSGGTARLSRNQYQPDRSFGLNGMNLAEGRRRAMDRLE
jgi:hypothetical protein